MKRVLLGVAAAAMTLTAAVASAQPYGGRHDWNRGDRSYSGGRYYNGGHQWRQGERFSYYRDRGRMIGDWRRYNLPPPRAGYAYYYDDNGDVVMAALASGIIGMVLGDALAGQPQPYYAPPAYAPPAYPYSYDYPYPY